jgi:hypothetical protein
VIYSVLHDLGILSVIRDLCFGFKSVNYTK